MKIILSGRPIVLGIIVGLADKYSQDVKKRIQRIDSTFYENHILMLHDLLFKHHKNLIIKLCDDLLNSPKSVKVKGKIVAWADILVKVQNFYFHIKNIIRNIKIRFRLL